MKNLHIVLVELSFDQKISWSDFVLSLTEKNLCWGGRSSTVSDFFYQVELLNIDISLCVVVKFPHCANQVTIQRLSVHYL